MPADAGEGAVVVRRSTDRFATDIDWLASRHSFSFGPHYDAGNTHHGLLVVSNDDVVAPGSGFETHPHRDMEIVTWVLDGALVHQDSAGHSGLIHPGLAQRMSAGSGILHSEKNDDRDQPVHFVQMWVLPDSGGDPPAYEQLDISAELDGGGLVTVASGLPRHRDQRAIGLRQRDAALHAARLRAGQHVLVPDAAYVHLYVARGAVDLEGAGRLGEGDAARLAAAGGLRATAVVDSEILVWEMHASL